MSSPDNNKIDVVVDEVVRLSRDVLIKLRTSELRNIIPSRPPTRRHTAPSAMKYSIPSKQANSFDGRKSIFLFTTEHSMLPQDYDISKSTQENYASDSKEFVGHFASVRESLDYDYHGNYTQERQLFQDEIIGKLLDGATVQSSTSGIVCKTPLKPWILFTAGVMPHNEGTIIQRVVSPKIVCHRGS